MTVTLVIPDYGSIDDFSVVVDDGSPRGGMRTQATVFPGVVYLIWWAGDLADWDAEDGRPIPEVTVQATGGMVAAVAWFDRVFTTNGGPAAGARQLFEASGLIEDPRLLAWVL
jgi:hypothetical protein